MMFIKINFIYGVFVCLVSAYLVYVMSVYTGGPYMLYALILGMLLRRFVYKARCISGVDFTAKKILRFGVALLGAKITFTEMSTLGLDVLGAMIGAVIATLIFGVVIGKILGLGVRMGVLTGGATAICGASAIMAIASVFPEDKKLEQQTLFTVVGVNILSTIAMIIYPLFCIWLGYNNLQSGVFLGGSIHDVAQVVGAGFSLSDSVGNIAVITKLLRVAMLLPIVFSLGVLIYVFAVRTNTAGLGTARPPFPWFLIGFLLLVVLNSYGVLSFVSVLDMRISDIFSHISKWMLIMAIVALGMKTSFFELASLGHKAVLLMVLETIFIMILLMGISSYII